MWSCTDIDVLSLKWISLYFTYFFFSLFAIEYILFPASSSKLFAKTRVGLLYKFSFLCFDETIFEYLIYWYIVSTLTLDFNFCCTFWKRLIDLTWHFPWTGLNLFLNISKIIILISSIALFISWFAATFCLINCVDLSFTISL